MKHTRFKIRMTCPLPFEVDRLPQLTVDQKMVLKIDFICTKRIRQVIQERLKIDTPTS